MQAEILILSNSSMCATILLAIILEQLEGEDFLKYVCVCEHSSGWQELHVVLYFSFVGL